MPTCSPSLRRGLFSRTSAALVTVGLAFSVTTTAIPAASATPLPTGAIAAISGFVASDLAANEDRISDAGWPQYGPTVDAVFALIASGAGAEQAAATVTVLRDEVEQYIGAGGESYAGPTGKLLTLASAQGVSATDFGGVNLVERLGSQLADSGRFVDVSEWGDYSNSIGQSWAILGLDRATGRVDASAVDFLRAQQCSDGGFRLHPETEPCVSNPDTTGMAVQALVAVAGSADPGAVKGTAYLAGLMDADGGVGGEPPTDAVNANTSGLAAGAFAAVGDTVNADRVRSYLASLYVGCAAAEDLRGAIAYDAAAQAAPELGTQLRVATGQAAVGLAGQSYVTISAAGNSPAPVRLDCNPASEPDGHSTATGSLGSLGSSWGS